MHRYAIPSKAAAAQRRPLRLSIAHTGISGIARFPCACGGACPRCQTKLPLSQPGDASEREADHVAEHVLRMPQGVDQTVPGSERAPAPAAAAGAIPPSSGQPLDTATREFFEPRLGADLRSIQIHADDRAASLSRGLAARAFTVGTHIWFGANEYAPRTAAGRRLLAHELAHTLQQRLLAPRVQRVPVVSNCSRAATANIRRAHTTARAWLAHALSRLTRPDEIAAELAYHFHAAPSDTHTIDMIRDELRAVQTALAREEISYNCAPADHPSCEEFVSGFAFLDSYDASFCEPLPQNYSDPLVTVLIHEAVHALAPGIPDGPYRSDADYPGDFPLGNTDAYSSLVYDLATDMLTGLPPPQEEESLGMLPGGGYGSSLSAWGIRTHLHGFPLDEATLTAEAQEWLDYLLADWAENLGDDAVVLRLAGYADSSGGAEHNRELGRSRAEAVRDYLLERLPGWSIAAPVDVVIESFGESRPFTTNRTRHGRALNRRVQIEVRRVTPRHNP